MMMMMKTAKSSGRFHHRRRPAFRALCCLWVLLLFLLGGGVLCVRPQPRNDYTVVERLGNVCPRLDSCGPVTSGGRRSASTRRLESITRERNCACDYLCAEYGDCCIDAAASYYSDEEDGMPETSLRHAKCFELKQFGGVYMRDTCPPSYKGPAEEKRLCEDSDPMDRQDPLGSMPVTDSLTGLTYKNYHCSLCNGKSDDIVLWTPRLECPLLTLFNDSRTLITDDYVVRNLATDGRGGWGLYLTDNGSGENSTNGSLFFHDCEVDPVMPPVLESKIRLCRPNLVSDCPAKWKDEEVRQLCHSYMGARYVHGGEGYRNVHCALCNGVNATQLSCQSAEFRGMEIFRTFGTHSFALLLDINEKRGQQVGKVRICEDGEVFDPFFKMCRSLTCLPGYVRRGRRCQLRATEAPEVAATALPAAPTEPPPALTDNDATVTPSSEELPAPDLSLSSGKSYNVSSDYKFLDCLLISLADEDYVMLPNRTVFVPKYDRLYEPTSYHASDGSVLVCSTHLTSVTSISGHVSKFPPLMGYVTVTGLGLSMLFLTLHFVAFCCVPELRNLAGRNLASQCLALFLAYACFIAGQFDSLAAGSPCVPIAFLTFYFFQASFFWMAVMAYDVCRTLHMATVHLRVVSAGPQSGRFAAYSLFAWTGPLILLLALAAAEYTELFPSAYRPGFSRGEPPCWFARRRSLLTFFASPLFAIMFANMLLFAASAFMVRSSTSSSMTARQTGEHRRNFCLYLRLALLMGVTWVVGLAAGSTDVPFLFHLFVVLNTLQGLFVFVAFSCTPKVMAHMRNRFSASPRPNEFKSSTSMTTKPSSLSGSSLRN